MSGLSRRTFLGSTALAGSALEVGGQNRGGAQTAAPNSIALTRPTLPALRRADVVVAGGSFAGVAAALALAKAGRKVVLVEPRTYLGREITATMRPWIAASASLPEMVRACTGRKNPYQFPNGKYVPTDEPEPALPSSGEIPLKLDKIKLVLENLLMDAGVDFFYASYPVGVAVENGALTGLIIGNKSGRQAIPCRAIVDATDTAVIARLAGAQFEGPGGGVVQYRRTIEFEKTGTFTDAEVTVPKDLGLANSKVTLHRGYRGPTHVLVEFGVEFRNPEFGPSEAMKREAEARHRTMQLAGWLVRNHGAFAEANLTHTSWELAGPATSRLAGPAPEWARALGPVRIGGADAPVAALAGPVKGLYCLQEAARVSAAQASVFADAVAAANAGEALASALLKNWDGAIAPQAEAGAPVEVAGAAGGLEVCEPESPQAGRQYEQFRVPASEVPVIRNVDVLVVGGGTSGATATAVAAREGVKTLLLEMNPALGGTGTVAAVDSYWFGRRCAFNTRVSERVAEVHKLINHKPEGGNTPRWNIEAKMYALLREAERAGAEVLFNTIVTGAIMDGTRVRGALVATRYGPFAVRSSVVIDATGDGDVAAFAGAESVYGSTMDHYGMWCTLAQFTNPGRNSNHFTSSVDLRNIEDYTRVILAGRRRGNNCHDHGIYVAARETRHILGDVMITLTDELRHRRWPDVINIHYSNHDVKGKTTSQWLQTGLIPPNLEIEIPYRALLPKSLDNIIVAGKAISSNHDGLASIRMQADIENLGGVVAIAAAKAVKEGKTPRRIDVGELQRRLNQEGVLPEEILTRKLRPHRRSEDELKQLVDAMLAEPPLQEYQDMPMFEVHRKRIPFIEVCTAGPRIVPHLEAAMKGPRRLIAAQALANYGVRSAAPVLIDAIQRSLAGNEVPARTRRVMYIQLPPDQGAMPDVCYLLYNLGMLRDRRSLAVWQRVADILNPTEAQFKEVARSPFHYVDSVCFGAERLGDPAAIPILEKLHAYPCLRNQIVRKGPQPDYLLERQAMCEMSIAKALARCGSPAGLALMIDYLDDNRTSLAEQSHTQLSMITGRDHGKEARAWRAWLDQSRDSVQPAPLSEDLDIWYEDEILVS